MIEEVKDLYDDVEKAVGKKGMWLLGGVAAIGAIFLVVRSKNRAEGVVYYEPTTVGNYPSVEENADLVLDSVNDLVDMIDSYGGTIGSRLDYLDDVIAKSEESVTEAVNKGTENVQQTVQSSTSQVIQSVQSSTSQVISNSNANKQEVQASVKEVQSVVDRIDNDDNRTQNVVSSGTPKAVTTASTPKAVTTASTTKTTTTSTPKAETYTYTTKSGLNTSTSIVDALKAAGADSSFAARKEIAEANGIKNYTGSASQNVALLNSMKAGTLKKA